MSATWILIEQFLFASSSWDAEGAAAQSIDKLSTGRVAFRSCQFQRLHIPLIAVLGLALKKKFPYRVRGSIMFEGVQTRTCNDSGFVLGAFSGAFSICFQEQVKC